MSDALTGGPDDVSLVVGTQKIAGWKSIAITRSVEIYPNSFAFTMTESSTASPPAFLVTPGQQCHVFIGSDLVLTGYVDRYSASISPSSHDVEIVGRGLGMDLVDCSADTLSADSPVKGSTINGTSTLDLAQKLARTYGVLVRSAVDDLGPPIKPIVVANGETPWEVIERVARYAAYLVYEDENGTLVLDRVGSKSMASGFAQGQNIEAASMSVSVDQRFTKYVAVWSTIDQTESGPNVSFSQAIAQASDVGLIAALGKRQRLRIFVSPQSQDVANFPEQLVNWDMARRRGRSQAIQLTCDSWRDSKGALWQPNYLALVDVPALRVVKQQWIIGSVVFRKDMSGTHADLTLMPPEAFSVQPSTLHLNDLEVSTALQNLP